MDTACLRIKFTPFMKNINGDNSKCCLEIVPEVSCLKNLDKIKWKQDDQFFEYVIPMTYKIILKRKDCQKDNIDKQNPLYHSCVDLLHDSTTTDLDSGDINRIVSDNIILTRVTTDIDKSGTINTQSNDTSNIKNVNDTVTTSVQTVEDSEVFTVVDHKLTDSIKTKETKQTFVFKNVNYPEDCLHKIIDTVKHLIKTPNTSSHKAFSPSCVNKNILIAETANQLKRNYARNLRKLSLSPIFSVDTDESTLKKPLLENVNGLSHLSPEYQLDKDIMAYFNPPLEERVLHVFSPIKLDNLIPQYSPVKRATPQERVGKFLKLINKEILPLRYVLDDILKKYSALNIPKDKIKNAVQCQEQLNEIKRYETPKIFKRPQNRVVHTIVFDD